MLINTKSKIDYFEAPKGIDELYCIHGSNISTTDKIVYYPPNFWRSAFPDQEPYVISGNGDGTVNIRSLEVCKSWPGVHYVVFPGAEHVRIMGDPRFINYLSDIVGSEKGKLVI